MDPRLSFQNPWALDMEKLTKLAMNFDPTPVMLDLQKQEQAMQPGPVDDTTPYSRMFGARPPAPFGQAQAAPFAAPLVAGPGGSPDLKKPPALSAQQTAQLAGMMPKTPEAKFIGGASPQKGTAINIPLDALLNLVKVSTTQAQGQPVPTLGSLIGGR